MKNVPNLKEIVTSDYDAMEKAMPNMFELKENGTMMNPMAFMHIFEKICEDTYELPEIKGLLNENFDLIILQPFMNDCALGFVHHFKTSLVLVVPIAAPPMISWVTGTPSPSSFIPSVFLAYSDNMNFKERMLNFGANLAWDLVQNWYFKPKMEALYREKLGDQSIPGVDTILGNTSLILSNGHFSLSGPKPYMPDVIDVCGMHCRPAEPLPKDLQDFLDSSPEGVIYFSMGSALQAHTMPEKYRKIFINTFSKLKQKVLWKWETEKMEDLPKNVKLGKWLPQQDILAHKNVKMFLTHGGYGGTTEAIYHGVPLLGMPMMGDQQLNMKKSEKAGFALTLDFVELTEDDLTKGIQRILSESKFKESALKLSKIFRDQPDKPLDRAVYWTEYVMRHKGAVHMRSAARELNFIQYHSLDVMAAYAAILFLVIYIPFWILRFLFRKICGGSSKKSSTKNTKAKKNN